MNTNNHKIVNDGDWVVCYLDILGYGRLVKDLYEYPSKVSDLRESIKNVINSAIGMFDSFLEEKSDDKLVKASQEMIKSVRFQVLSDSILISKPLHNLPNLVEGSTENENVFANIRMFLQICAYSILLISVKIGYLFRGSIAIGQHYQSSFDERKPENQFIFSKALVIAFELYKTATFPRILVDWSVVQRLEQNTTLNFNYYIRKDYDGLYILDVYKFFSNFANKGRNFFEDIRKVIEYQVEINKHKPEVLQKLYYYAQYHNKCMQDMQLETALKLDINSFFYK